MPAEPSPEGGNPATDWIISVDDHVLEPADVWDGRLPRHLQDAAPKVVRDSQGEAWYFEGIRRPTTGMVATAGKSAEDFSSGEVSYSEMRRGCYDPHERLKDMDLDRVLASLCFPSFPRFAGQVFSETADRELGLACLKAYNDWMVDVWCADTGGRLIPLMCIPYWDPAEAAAEIDRMAAKGSRAIAFSENPAPLGWPSIHNAERYWDPVFAAAVHHDMPLCSHIGSSSRFPKTAEDAPPLVSFSVGPLANASQCLADWLWSGVLQRFPKLKVCLSEGSIGWIPYVLERCEQVFDKQRFAMSGQFERDPWTGALVKKEGSARDGVPQVHPRELFRDHIFGCFFDDAHGVTSIEEIGIDNVMVETDYPHSDSMWPNSYEVLAKQSSHLSAPERYRLFQGNARRVFGIDPTPPRSR